MTTTGKVPAGTNWDLLDRAIAHIDAHPEEHNQREWVCGTTACIAGHMVMLADGLTFAELNDFREGTGRFEAGWSDLPTVSGRARELLNNDDLAEAVFYEMFYDKVKRNIEAYRLQELTGFNWPLLHQVLDYVRADPDEHDQAAWVCATTACLAGHLVMFADGLTRAELSDMQGLRGAFKGKRDVPTIKNRALEVLGAAFGTPHYGFATSLFFADDLAEIDRFVEERLTGERLITARQRAVQGADA